MKKSSWFVFLAAFGWFSIRAAQAWLVAGWLDPVSRIGVQDEATYSRIVLEMLERHRWLLPVFLDRIAFFKPPLLYWLSGASASLFGISAYALRLPAILAAAGVCSIAFAWVARKRGAWAGGVAAVLIAGNYYWILLGSVNMTDGLLVFFALCALFAVEVDPLLAQRRTILVISVSLGAAILTKSIAALPTMAVVALYAMFSRAPWRRLAALLCGPFVVASPWFAYALIFHFQWFWREHVLTEILGRNAAGVSVASPLSNVAFYFERLAWPDPVLAIVGATALLIWRTSGRALALLWLGLTAVALLVFGYHYHGANYLLPAITALAILAGLSLPRMRGRWGVPLLAVLIAVEGWKIWRDPAMVWRGTNLTMAPALLNYCEQHRSNTLMVMETDDEFFSASQPLARVRYGLIDEGRAAIRLPIDFQGLGITATREEFDDRARTWPVFRARLTAIGLPPSLDPRGTVVLFRDGDDIRDFIRQHPQIDFLAPDRDVPGDAGHRATRADAEHQLLWATAPDPETPIRAHAWSCRI